MRVFTVLFFALGLPGVLLVFAQNVKSRPRPDPANGERLFQSGCIACHGSDGKGAPLTSTAFTRSENFPDFTKCDQTTPEPDTAWKDVIVHGGPARRFSQIMPAFGELLSSDQIDDVIIYLRGLCTNSHWPRGELNLPRALLTEKAFPEDEVVISSAINAHGAPGVTTHIIHEQRFGMKNQIEIDVPITFQDQNHIRQGGVGDVSFGLKRVMYSNLHSGSILSLQGGVIAPTGDRARGFGAGTTTFEPFAAFDQLLPAHTFLQFQAGADLPRHPDIAPQLLFWRTALGKSFAASQGLGRLWTPMVEFTADRELSAGAKTNWDVTPQMQVTVSRRQHIRASIGVRKPATNTAGRPAQVMFYLLWDRADGKLTEGW